TPIRPVEATATSMAPRPSSVAACSAVAWVSWKPSGPVQAFAPPELRTTARTRPPRTTCWVHSTGAALTRFAVNTPAAARDGPSLSTTATSRSPVDLRPAATPAARKPSGAVTLMAWSRWPAPQRVSWRDSIHGQARALRQAEHQVGDLDGLPGRALDQVVQGGHHHGPARVLVGRGLEV